MIRAVRTRLGVLSLLTAGSLALGCGDDGDKGTETGNLPAGAATLTLTFSPMHSAFIEGGPPCKLPVIAKGGSGKVTFTAADPSMVDIEETADGAMLTMKKAGTTTITGKTSDGSFGTAILNITAVSKADYDIGKDRYNSGVAAFNFDGGLPMPGMGGLNPAMFMPDPESACTFCHRPDGMASEGTAGIGMIDIEHTPQQIGGYSDEDLIKIFTEGQKPEGVPLRIITIPGIWSNIHKWNVEENVKNGIIGYLRSIEPKPQGEIDFGGIIRARFDGGLPNFGDGGFMFPRRDAGGTTPTPETDAGTDADTTEEDPDAGAPDPDAG